MKRFRRYMEEHYFWPESGQEWFALVWGTAMGGVVGYATVVAIVAAVRGH